MFYSVKGGSGKSTAAANVAVELANRGYDILCIDLDLGGGGIRYLFDLDDDDIYCIQEYLNGKEFSFDKLTSITGIEKDGSLQILPSDKKLHKIGKAHDFQYEKIKELITESNDYDVIIIDSPGGWGLGSASAMRFSNVIFILLRFSKQHFFGTRNHFKDTNLILRNPAKKFYSITSCVPPKQYRDRKDFYLKYYQSFQKISVEIPENKELKWNERVIINDKKHHKTNKAYKEIADIIVSRIGD